MVRMVGRQRRNNQTTMHFHKQTVRGMVMVQIPPDMLVTKHKLHQPLTIRDNKDINRTHDNFI